MKLIYVLIVWTFGFQSETAVTQTQADIKAKLQDVSYYAKCNCTEDKPVLVRVKYHVKYDNLGNLKMRHIYDGGITNTVPVKEFDKDGSVVYHFCVAENSGMHFTTVFTDTEGDKSKPIPVYISPDKTKIINGTAPATLKIDKTK